MYYNITCPMIAFNDKESSINFSKKTCILDIGTSGSIKQFAYTGNREVLSRELRSAAEWRRGVRCRGGFAEMSLDCRLENARDAARDAGEMRGRESLRRRVQGRGYGRWNSPYPESCESNQTHPSSCRFFFIRDASVVSPDDLVEAKRSRCCQKRFCCRE